MKPQHGRRRVVIENVNPQIDGGRHAIRRIAGDEVFVTAAIYADGKDELAARLLYRPSRDIRWRFVPMQATGNDLLRGAQYVWRDRNYIALRPGVQPTHILRVRRMQ